MSILYNYEYYALFLHTSLMNNIHFSCIYSKNHQSHKAVADKKLSATVISFLNLNRPSEGIREPSPLDSGQCII